MADEPSQQEVELLDANPWWAAALAWAGEERARVVPLRDLGGDLTTSPLWVLAPGGNALRAGQFGVALLLDAAHRANPQTYPALVSALAGWRRVDAPELVGALWRALMPMLIQFTKGLPERPASIRDVPRVLAAAGDVLPWDAACADGDDALRNAARAVLDWRNGTAHLGRYRLGAWLAAEWCADTAGAMRMMRMSPPTNVRALFRDVIVTAILAVVRRGAAATRGDGPTPNPLVMNVSRVPTIAPVDEAPDVPLPAPPDNAGPSPCSSWWDVAKVWAGDRRRDPGVLIELAHAFEKRPLWPLVEKDMARLGASAAVRANQRGRVLLAIAFDEFIRPYPHKFVELLDTIVPPDDVVLTFEHCATHQNLYSAVYDGWAKTLAGRDVSGAAIPKQLNLHGGIVPWDSTGGLDEARREAMQDACIEKAFGGGNEDVLDIWRGVYWASIRVRNDLVHGKPQSLRGRLRPTDLRVDMLLFHGLAGLRFRAALAKRDNIVMTMPEFDCL